MTPSDLMPEDSSRELKLQRIEDLSTIICLASKRGRAGVKAADRSVQFSVMQGKYSIFRTGKEAPVGYATWADVNIETILRIDRGAVAPKYVYEWDEGSIRLMLDVVLDGFVRNAALRSLVVRSEIDSKQLVYRRRERWKHYVSDRGCFKTVSAQWLQDAYSE